jgi:hypothetical protein
VEGGGFCRLGVALSAAERAGCPAPEGFSKVVFLPARTSFAFADGKSLTSTLTRSCGVR